MFLFLKMEDYDPYLEAFNTLSNGDNINITNTTAITTSEIISEIRELGIFLKKEINNIIMRIYFYFICIVIIFTFVFFNFLRLFISLFS